MDMHCRFCGEPWDHDELHNGYGLPYKEMGERFRKLGCNAFDIDTNKPCAVGGIDEDRSASVEAMMSLSDYPEEWCE